jgi:hypothetical protein
MIFGFICETFNEACKKNKGDDFVLIPGQVIQEVQNTVVSGRRYRSEPEGLRVQ